MSREINLSMLAVRGIERDIYTAFRSAVGGKYNVSVGVSAGRLAKKGDYTLRLVGRDSDITITQSLRYVPGRLAETAAAIKLWLGRHPFGE